MRIHTKLAIRSVVLLFAIAALIVGYRTLRDKVLTDPYGVRGANTVGMIAAVEQMTDGSRAVVFTADGKKVVSDGYKSPAGDTDLAWSPDGNRLFFASDRGGNSFNIYRWKPDSNTVDKRWEGTRSTTRPWLGPDSDPLANKTALLITGGFVLDLDIANKTTQQILPPKGKGATQGDEEGGAGSTGQMDMYKGPMGLDQTANVSFREARWAVGHQIIYAVVRRDGGEVLFLQRVDGSTAQELAPRPLLAAQNLDIDVASDGSAVVAIRGFQFVNPENPPKEFIQNHKAKVPFKHGVVRVTLHDNGEPSLEPILRSDLDSVTPADPRISPDGAKIALVFGKIVDGVNFAPEALGVAPFTADGGKALSPVLRGPVRQPSWSPDGSMLAYVKRDPGTKKQKVFTIHVDGSSEKAITTDDGDYSSPLFSPQSAVSSSGN